MDRALAAIDEALADAPELRHLSEAARRVLVTAAALFLHNGAAGTSVRDITRACGLSPGALYNHFASKDDLLFALVQHGHGALERRVAEALDAAADSGPRVRTAAFVRGYVLAHLLRPELAQVVRREYLHLTPERCQLIVLRRRGMRARLASLLREGAAAGDFNLLDGPHAATRAAVMVLDMCSRTSEWYDPTRRGEPPAAVAERYVAGALRLVGAS